jgi:hypothetical protein
VLNPRVDSKETDRDVHEEKASETQNRHRLTISNRDANCVWLSQKRTTETKDKFNSRLSSQSPETEIRLFIA